MRNLEKILVKSCHVTTVQNIETIKSTLNAVDRSDIDTSSDVNVALNYAMI